MGGGGGIGGIIGAVAGAILAPFTGGTSLALIGAGAGLGAATGMAVGTMLTKSGQPKVYSGTKASDAIKEAETARENAAMKESERLRKRRGAAATIVSGIPGDESEAPTLKRTLGGV